MTDSCSKEINNTYTTKNLKYQSNKKTYNVTVSYNKIGKKALKDLANIIIKIYS